MPRLARHLAQFGKFEEALADEKGEAPLRAAQQIANLLDRSAKKASAAQQAKLQAEALDWLKKVAPLADTAELAALRRRLLQTHGGFEAGFGRIQTSCRVAQEGEKL